MAKTNNGLVAVAVFLGITALTPAASARDQLRIVGSSTVSVHDRRCRAVRQGNRRQDTGDRVDRHRRRDEDLLRGHRRRQGRRDERLAPHEKESSTPVRKMGSPKSSR